MAVRKKTPVRKKAAAKKKAAPKKKGQHGGARKGAGRKVSPTTIKSRKIAEKLAEDQGLTPLEYMLEVLRSGPEEIKAKYESGDLDDAEYLAELQKLQGRRDWAAEKAAPYIHPRLASIEQKGAGGGQEDWLDVVEEGIEAGRGV